MTGKTKPVEWVKKRERKKGVELVFLAYSSTRKINNKKWKSFTSILIYHAKKITIEKLKFIPVQKTEMFNSITIFLEMHLLSLIKWDSLDFRPKKTSIFKIK